MRTSPLVAVLVLASLHVSARTAPAQEREVPDEAVVLRQAVSLEARGRYAEARALLEDLLRAEPTSSAGLFSLERVLRPLGELGAVLPFADRFLEREPAASGARYLKLRVLSEVDSVAGIAPAVEDWVRAAPRSPEPYREGARLLEEHHGPERALPLLRRGRDALGSPSALSLEIGDVLLRSGDQRAAVEEWGRAVGEDGRDATLVLRRLDLLEGDRGEVVRPLLSILAREPSPLERRRVAVRIAVAAGLSEEAVELATSVTRGIEPGQRRGFLAELAGSAEEAGLPAVTLWAFRSLRELAGGERESRALDQRIAEAALAAGDTAAAVEAGERLVRSLPAGSAERRRASAELIRIEATRADPQSLFRRLETFRSEFPDSPELDALASAVSAALLVRGREDDAARVLEGVTGPRSALERAFLLFEEGSIEQGAEALLASVTGLDPARATDVIQLAALLERLSPAADGVVGRAAALAHRGAVDEALAVVRDGLDALPADDRPAVLAHAARLAETGGRDRDAAGLRERLLEAHPDAAETAEATLELARWRARDPEGVADAVRLLEGLILERPNNAVVPAARRELARLSSGSLR